MRSVSPIFFCALLLVCSPAFSADCGPEFRLDEDGGPMEQVPVLDQGEIGSCYAYVGAQMLDAWRFGNGIKPDGRHIRPEALAIDSALAEETERSNLDGGKTINVLKAGLAGACVQWQADPKKLQGWLSKAGNTAWLNRHYQDSIRSDERYLAQLENPGYCEELSKGGVDPASQRANCLERLKNRRQASTVVRSKLLNDCREFAVAGGAPSEAIQRLEAQLEEILSKTDYPPLAPAGLAKDAVACDPKNRIEIPEPKPTPVSRSFPKYGATEIKKFLNDHFQASSQPVGIDFCSHLLLREPGGRKYKFTDYSQENCGPHASLVVGRRKTFFGRCQYLIRNSWGKGCDRYNFDWDCDDGNIWVDEETLTSNTYRTTLLQK